MDLSADTLVTGIVGAQQQRRNVPRQPEVRVPWHQACCMTSGIVAGQSGAVVQNGQAYEYAAANTVWFKEVFIEACSAVVSQLVIYNSCISCNASRTVM